MAKPSQIQVLGLWKVLAFLLVSFITALGKTCLCSIPGSLQNYCHRHPFCSCPSLIWKAFPSFFFFQVLPNLALSPLPLKFTCRSVPLHILYTSLLVAHCQFCASKNMSSFLAVCCGFTHTSLLLQTIRGFWGQGPHLSLLLNLKEIRLIPKRNIKCM